MKTGIIKLIETNGSVAYMADPSIGRYSYHAKDAVEVTIARFEESQVKHNRSNDGSTLLFIEAGK